MPIAAAAVFLAGEGAAQINGTALAVLRDVDDKNSLVAILGLLPASIATGLGSDVQRPMATVIVWGAGARGSLVSLSPPADVPLRPQDRERLPP